jgi:hypothetical protein
MVKHRATFDTVRRIGLELPGVEDGTAHGNLALKAHGKLLACVPTHRSAEPDSLVVKVDFEDRAETILNYLSPEIQVTRIGLGEQWRRGLKVVFRQ